MFVRHTYIAAALFALGATGTAFAQSVIITPEQEVVVREYVVREAPPVVELPSDFDVVVGAELPDTISVTPLGAPGFEKQYEYVVVDGRTLLVDPETRRVVHILQ